MLKYVGNICMMTWPKLLEMLAVPECAVSSSSPVSHSYPTVLYLEADFSWCILWSLSCSPCASSAKQRSSRYLMRQAKRFSIISVTHCTSFTFSLPSFKDRDSKGRNLPYRVEFWEHMLCHVPFYNQSRGDVLVTWINMCSSSAASLCFSQGLSSW